MATPPEKDSSHKWNWIFSGALSLAVMMGSGVFAMWQNDAVQDQKMIRNRADIDAQLVHIQNLANKVWELEKEVAGNKAQREETLGEISEGMKTLLKKDRFRREDR